MSRHGRSYIPWKERKPPVIGAATDAPLPPQTPLGISTAIVDARKRHSWAPAWDARKPPIEFEPPGGPPFLAPVTAASHAALLAPQARARQPVLTRHLKPTILGAYVPPVAPVVDTSLSPAVATLRGANKGGFGTNEPVITLSLGNARPVLKGPDNRATIQGY